MRCIACGATPPPAARFCDACGTALAVACGTCGRANRPGSQFCAACGAAIETPSSPTEISLTLGDEPEGGRKQVTVLFADIEGSTELIRDRDPEEAQRLLDGAIKVMMDAVRRYEGTVSRLMGDGLMALFGAPLAHEDHAVRACYAALAMREAIGAYAEETERRHGAAVRVRIGLNSGEVVVRVIADDLHLDYTALGQAVNLAARMEQIAAPGSIRLTTETLRLAEGFVLARPLGPVEVRGLIEPIDVFELLELGPVQSRLQASAARGLARFVGRQLELAALRRIREHVDGGHGQVVALVGEAGVGKSRLVAEFARSEWPRDWPVLEAGSGLHRRDGAYRSIVDLVRAYCGIEPGDHDATIRQKIADRLSALDPSCDAWVAPLLWLLDIPVDDPAWASLDPDRRREQTRVALEHILLLESRAHPLLLVFEDLQAVDPETVSLLNSLIDRLPASRILLLVTYRPGLHHSWSARSCYTQVQVDPLAPETARHLLAALIGSDVTLEPLVDLLIARTDGVPFFLEECVRSLVETDALVGDRGGYRLARALPEIRVPARVQSVLAARIDRLPRDSRWLLQVAAVIGPRVPLDLLRVVADIPEGLLQSGLAQLRGAGLLYQVGAPSNPEYSFTHALTHEVTYGGLLQHRRRVLHARIVEALESLWPDPPSEQIDELARHAYLGELGEKAVLYLRRAAVRAADRSAHRDAARALRQALDALTHVSKSDEALAEGIDLRFALRASLLPLGEIDSILELLEQAEHLAEELGDETRLGRISSYKTAHCWQIGENIGALEAGRRALTIAERTGDFALKVATHQHLAQVYYTLGEYRTAIDIIRRNLDLLRGDLVRERFGVAGYPAVGGHNVLSWCLAAIGEFDDAIEAVETALRLSEELNDRFSQVYAGYRAAGVLVHRGDLDRALPLIRLAYERCREWGFSSLMPWVEAVFGHALALSGQLDEALPTLERAVEDAKAIHFTTLQSRWLTWLSQAYLLAGRPEAASQRADQALELALERRERGNQVYARHQLAEIAVSLEPLDALHAESAFREAATLADELGMRPVLAHSHLGLAGLYRRSGRHEDARDELAMAGQLFAAMGMTTWLAHAESTV